MDNLVNNRPYTWNREKYPVFKEYEMKDDLRNCR